MELKELMRELVTGEIYDIAIYSAEADLFISLPNHGPEISELFTRLADEKRARLKDFDKITRERTGFRQRHHEPPRSIEASLRLHITLTEKNIVLYGHLIKSLTNPEYKETFKGIMIREMEVLKSLRALQALIKQKK